MTAETLTRLYEAPEVHQLDGRTIKLTAVRYGEVAEVVDVLPSGLDKYRESFAPNVFAAQTSSSEPGTLRRINFLDEHAGGTGKLGYLLAAEDLPDRLDLTMRVMRSREADVEQLLEDGITGASVGFVPLRGGTRVEDDGTRVRTRGHLRHIALVAEGAYRSSKVLAYRDDAEAERVAERASAEADAAMRDALDWVAAERDRWATIRGDA